MNRDQAWQTVCEHTPSEALRRHMLAVETCMRWYANQQGADEETWGIAGLLHDFDYEQHPDEHPLWGIDHLRQKGADEEVLNAIAAHYPEKTGVQPETPIQRYLFACDEISGFVTACAYVRPSRSVSDMEPKSVLKKLKVPNFAAGVNRQDVARGAELIGLPLEGHIANVIQAMRSNAESLGV